MRRHLFRSFVLFFLLGVSTLALDVRLAKTESAAIVVPDDFLTIQEAINSAIDGDVVFVKTGTYYEHVVVNKTVSLVGENSDTTIIDGNGTGHVVDITRDNVNVANFTVRKGGSNMFPDFEAGISLNNSKGCLIMSNNVDDNGCFGIHLLNSDQNTISRNNFTRNAMYAIDLTESDRNTISFNTAAFNTNIAIGMHITSNNNIITGNTIVNNPYGIDAANACNNTISNNNVANNSEMGIWIQDNANNNTISGNILTRGQFGIQILNSRYTEILNNTIAHNHGSGWGTGIRLESAGYTLIHDNEITDNWRAIHLIASSPNVSIYRNNVTYNEFGIRVLGGGSNYLNVSDNYIANNLGGYGVGVTGIGGESSHAVISGNAIINNIDGIALGQGSNYNTVFQNNISQNEYGIGMENSTQNLIYSNNIIANIHQASVTYGSINVWDNGYPYGGNCWSDYVSSDLFSGPCQNVTGGDGIGDSPYVIDVNNRDNYPFMLVSICNVSQVPENGMISPSDEVKINATITHLYSLERVMLNYTIVNDTGTLHFSFDMTNAEGDSWNATIAAFPAGTNVTYIVIGRDSQGNTVNSQQQGYTLEYHVIPEFSLIWTLPILSTAMLVVSMIVKRRHAFLIVRYKEIRENQPQKT